MTADYYRRPAPLPLLDRIAVLEARIAVLEAQGQDRPTPQDHRPTCPTCGRPW